MLSQHFGTQRVRALVRKLKRWRRRDEQIVGFLKQAKADMAVNELCRKGGFSGAAIYKWRARLRSASSHKNDRDPFC